MQVVENIAHEHGRLQETILKDQEYLLRIFNVYGKKKYICTTIITFKFSQLAVGRGVTRAYAVT